MTFKKAEQDYQSIIDITRPPITAQSLDLFSVNRQGINADGTFGCLIIPLRRIDNNSKEWNAFQYDDMWEYLMSNTDYTGINLEECVPNLFLQINNNDDTEEKDKYSYSIGIYTIERNEKIAYTEFIKLDDKEKTIVELAILKLTNYQEYIRRYRRIQIAKLPEIKNSFDFYNDSIMTDGSYKSTWISSDFKKCMLAYIENAKDIKSYVHLLAM